MLNLLDLPLEVKNGRTCLLAKTGSHAFGVNDDSSDIDVMGIVIPPREILFPYKNKIFGFGAVPEPFEQCELFHVDIDGKSHDFTFYNIVKIFDLATKSNPNIVDYIFVPDRCIIQSDSIWNIIKNNRTLFLSKQIENKFIGYAYSQIKKIEEKKNFQNKKRQAWANEYGYDLKFAYHCVRLLLEAEYIAEYNDLNVECNVLILKDIRNGLWTFDDIKNFFDEKTKDIKHKFSISELPDKPDIGKIENVLIQCLKEQFGAFL